MRIRWNLLFWCLFVLFSSTPLFAQPELVARFLDTTGADITFRGVEEKDGWVYALRRDAELFVFDTRSTLFNPDPSAGPLDEPLVFDTPERHFSLGGFYGNGLIRTGDVMYAFGGDGILVFDLTDPSNPTQIGDAVPGFSSNLYLHGSQLLNCRGNLIEVFSLADPKIPAKVSEIQTTEGNFWAVAAFGELIYASILGPMGADWSALRVYYFSDPASPQFLKEISYPQRDDDVPYHLKVIGNHLVESTAKKIRIRDLGNSGLKLTLLDEQQFWGRVCAVAGNQIIGNGHLYQLNQGKLDLVSELTTGDGHQDGYPHGAVIRHDLALIAQRNQVAAVRYVSPPALVFPQLAWGGGVASELFLSNPAEDEVTGRIVFKNGSGAPVAVSVDGTPVHSIPFSLPEGGVFKVKTDNTGSLQVGYAAVIADPFDTAITGTVAYNLEGFEVSVPNAVSSNQYHVMIERNSGANSGLAIANPGFLDAEVDLNLLEEDGTLLLQGKVQLGPGAKEAKFINEFLSGVPSEFLGSLHIQSDQAVAVSGFRLLTTGSLLSLSGSPVAVDPPE